MDHSKHAYHRAERLGDLYQLDWLFGTSGTAQCLGTGELQLGKGQSRWPPQLLAESTFHEESF